jgi:hypothetical protein
VELSARIRFACPGRLEQVSAISMSWQHITPKMHNRTVSQPIATTSSLHEQEKPEQSSQSSSQPAGGSLVGAPTLIDFLHAVPAPLVVLLVRLAPPLASLRYVAQILSWQTSWIDCWLLLAAWWAAVLFTDFALRSVTFKFPWNHELTFSKILPFCRDMFRSGVLQTTATTTAV